MAPFCETSGTSMLHVVIVAAVDGVVAPCRTLRSLKFERPEAKCESATTHRIAPPVSAVLSDIIRGAGPAVIVCILLVDHRLSIAERIGPLAGYASRPWEWPRHSLIPVDRIPCIEVSVRVAANPCWIESCYVQAYTIRTCRYCILINRTADVTPAVYPASVIRVVLILEKTD